MSIVLRKMTIHCNDCGFTTADMRLAENHSCDTQMNGGLCEDYPCCGHERGDCNGQLYGSDEAIKERVQSDWATGHGYCDHQEGIYNCEDEDEDDEPELDDENTEPWEDEDGWLSPGAE